MDARVVVVALAIASSALVSGHECERPCVKGDVRTCRYEWHVQPYHTMGRACFDCANTPSDCLRDECVAADGVPSSMLAVNRQLPGPAIEVCIGDRLVVDVILHQFSDTETIHWHGQHMHDYQYYDGVPFLTQCPIETAFRYDFPAATPGTHWWHSHSAFHREEGVFGALVVRLPEDPLHELYQVDEQVLIFHDWTHTSGLDKFLGKHQYKSDDFAKTILINGKGRNTAAKADGVAVVETPLEVVRISPNIKYRLRLISSTSLNCPLIISIDGHEMIVVAMDGVEIFPYTTQSLVMYSGERFDVVVDANQPVDNYWIRANGLIDCEPYQCVQGAVLRYEGAAEVEPNTPLQYDSTYPSGPVLNPLNSVDGVDDVTLVDLDSFFPNQVPQHVDKQFWLGFDFSAVNNTELYNPALYPYNGVTEEWQVNTPQVNHLSFMPPFTPPLSQPDVPIFLLCRYGEDLSRFCDGDFCVCTYTLEAEVGDVVEMVLVAQGQIGDENHPIHLHGHNFAVVAMGKLGSSTTVAEVQELDAAGGITRKLENAILKDSLTIPDGGYTIIRFTADNPGWWLMHCHLGFHSQIGMDVLFHVGGPGDVPPVPEGFPTCGPFMPPAI